MALQTLKNLNRDTPAEAKQGFPAMLEKFKGEIARALPKHINPDRMARIALTAFRMTPKLGECDPRSVFAAVIQASQLGLEVGLMGEAHLVPFGDQCQLIPGYTGLMKLARQSGLVQDIYAHEVRVNDKFTLKLGMERSLEHEPLTGPGGFPASDEERGEVVGFYAVAVFKDGSRTFVAMSRKEVEKIRDNSKGYQAAKRYKKESVWDSDFTAMGLKTAIRRLCKFLPKSPELATALALDAASEQGKAQNLNLNDVIEGNYAPVVIDEETGEVLDADEKAGAKPDPTAQKPKETKAEIMGGVKATQVKVNEGVTAFVVDPAEQGDAAKPNAKLATAIKAMEKATTNEALDEIYIRLEADFEGTDLEALTREYRRIKADIGSLI
ncbi:recombinase RecT [Burkholderia multivorans]|uniref:recombinase RecT n=1 Tax=Burkholderia multivorans TaxID=87883 RepID=UPI001C219833|nr:recombinase RecT [Burkholderia multivorans]MBU9211681.1 recombinase RecT [Burkholderia multivorans]